MITLACPACGKTSIETDATCPRCRCDLTQLRSIASHAWRHLAEAETNLRRGNWPEAGRHAEQSWRLRHSARAAQLAVLVAAAQGDSAEVTRWLPLARRETLK